MNTIRIIFITIGMICQVAVGNEGISAGKIPNSVETVVDIHSRIYPSTVYFGDTVYCEIIRTNNTNEAQMMIVSVSPISEQGYYFDRIEFSLQYGNFTYDCMPEVSNNGKRKSMSAWIYNLDDGKTMNVGASLELPPLEALEHPLWKEVIDNMTENGVKCTLTIKMSVEKSEPFKEPPPEGFVIHTHEMLIMPRRETEMALLKTWYNKTPKQFLPHIRENRSHKSNDMMADVDYNSFIKTGYRKSGGNFITVNGKKYNPWLFIRERNRKPPAVLCPNDAKGWKQLEESLSPSTMRDEIKMTRMLLEYFELSGRAQVDKRQLIKEWLSNLPEPQRVCMASHLDANRFQYSKDNPLTEPYVKLLDELRPFMTTYHQGKY